MTRKCPVQNFKKISSEVTENRRKACASDNCVIDSRSHAIEMVFVFIATGHAGSSARSFMLSGK